MNGWLCKVQRRPKGEAQLCSFMIRSLLGWLWSVLWDLSSGGCVAFTRWGTLDTASRRGTPSLTWLFNASRVFWLVMYWVGLDFRGPCESFAVGHAIRKQTRVIAHIGSVFK